MPDECTARRRVRRVSLSECASTGHGRFTSGCRSPRRCRAARGTLVTARFRFARLRIVVRTNDHRTRYWRSTEQLLAYAKDRDAQHLLAWRAFNKAIGRAATSASGPPRHSNRHGSSAILTLPLRGPATYGSETFKTSFPKFSPLNNFSNVCGNVSSPSTTSSRETSLPALIQPAISRSASS